MNTLILRLAIVIYALACVMVTPAFSSQFPHIDVVTQHAGTLLSSDAPASPHTFAPGVTMFSVPDDYTGQSLNSVLGYASPTLAVWDPTASSYAVTPSPLANSLAVGRGYWARFPTAETIAATGTPATATTTVNLATGWNMIGCPGNASIPLSALTFIDSLNVSHSYFDSVATGLIHDPLYTFQPGDTNYEVVSGPNGFLSAYYGYWLYAIQPCELVFPAPTVATILEPGVVLIHQDGSVTYSNVTETSETLTGAVPQLNAGNVIVGGPSAPYIRIITAVTQEAGTTTLQTEAGGLTDVFDQVDIRSAGSISPEAFTVAPDAPPGTTITSEASPALSQANPKDTVTLKPIDLNITAATVGTNLTVSGKISIQPYRTFYLRMENNQLDYLYATVTTSTKYKIDVKLGTGDLGKKDFAKFSVPLPIVVPGPYGIQIPIPCSLDGKVTLDGSFSVSDSTATISSTTQHEVGVIYDGDSFTAVDQTSGGDSYIPTNNIIHAGTAQIKVGESNQFNILNVGGPTAKVDAFATATLTGGSSGKGCALDLKSGVEGTVGISASDALKALLGLGKLEFTAPMNLYNGPTESAYLLLDSTNTPALVDSVDVSLDNPTLSAGHTAEVTTLGHDVISNGQVTVPNNCLVWTSSSPNIATVSVDGIVSGVATGTASITGALPPSTISNSTGVSVDGNPFAGTYSGAFSGGGSGTDQGTFKAVISSSGAVTVTGVDVFSSNGHSQAIPFSGIGTVTTNGITQVSGTGAGIYPISFGGTFTKSGNTKSGAGSYNVSGPMGFSTSGQWVAQYSHS